MVRREIDNVGGVELRGEVDVEDVCRIMEENMPIVSEAGGKGRGRARKDQRRCMISSGESCTTGLQRSQAARQGERNQHSLIDPLANLPLTLLSKNVEIVERSLDCISGSR
jgi:hypothetical protein